MADFLNSIEDGMKDLIAGMDTSGDYNFDWDPDSINQPDLAKCSFPNALIMLETEDNVDEEDSPFADGYSNEATYQIIVRATLTEETDVPVFEINAELNKALTDLKKLFGVNYSVSGQCDWIMYRGMEREFDGQGDDIFVPSRMITRWVVRYSQGRRDPEEIAS